MLFVNSSACRCFLFTTLFRPKSLDPSPVHGKKLYESL
jgi:hypothetical protein